MPDHTLRDCRILLVEDEYMLADDLQTELTEAQAIVVGPAPTVGAALALIDAQERIDGGILDVNLGGEMVFPVADRLIEREIPFIFATGYDNSVIPSRFADVVHCDKPVDMKRVARTLGRVVHST